MADTVIYVGCTSNQTNSQDPWQDNELFNLTAIAEVISDLLDEGQVSTGYTLDITSAWTGVTGATTASVAAAGGWIQEAFDYGQYIGSGGTGSFQVGGLTEGDTFSLEVAGHNSNGARNADITVTPSNEGSQTYNVSGTTTPTAPDIFTGTIGAAGTIDIDVDIVDTFAYFNGFKLTITPVGGGGGGGNFMPASSHSMMVRF